MSARKMTELTVRVESEVGELAKILGLSSQAGANVLAFCGYEHGGGDTGATVMLVVDKPDKAQDLLKREGYSVTANPVVAVGGAAGRGMGAKVAERIAKGGINILYSYASSTGTGQSIAIFRVLKPDQALKALKA